MTLKIAATTLRGVLFAGVFAFTAAVARGDSEIVIAIRYLQAKNTSHSHLYLYREDGKRLRQLTRDNSGQDVDPIFSANGETIVFARENPKDAREFWSINPRGTQLKKLDAAPDWYAATKSSPVFEAAGEEESPSPSLTPQEEASPSATAESDQQAGQHQSGTALDAVAAAEGRSPETINAPDGSGEIFWRKGKQGEGPEESLNWVMWYRDSKSGQETEIGRLPGFPSFEPLQIRQGKDRNFLFEGPLHLAFFGTHLDSTSGSTVLAFNFNTRKLVRLSVNWATPIPLPGEAAFLTLTENRYVEIPGSSKTANCSYIERWDANLKESCDNYDGYLRFISVSTQLEVLTPEQWKEHLHEGDGSERHDCYGEPEVRYARKKSAAICYGASMYRSGKTPSVITIRNAPGGDHAL